MIRFNQILNKDVEGQKTTAVMLGGIDDPTIAITYATQANSSSSLASGTYYVSYTWYNSYGETMPSPEVVIAVAAQQEMDFTLPTKPSNATGAYIYIGTATNNKTRQIATSALTCSFYNLLTPTAISAPTANITYEWITPVEVRYALPTGDNILGYVKLHDGTNAMLIDVNGSAHMIPYNSAGSELFTASAPGNVQLRKQSAKEPFGGTTTTTHVFNVMMNGFVISNDGDQDLSFTIGTDTFTVKPGEIFDDFFDPFTTVTVNTTVSFRAYGRG